MWGKMVTAKNDCYSSASAQLFPLQSALSISFRSTAIGDESNNCQ